MRQPDDTSGGENCAEMDRTIIRAVGLGDTAGVNDASCGLSLEYVCETELWPVWGRS